MEASYPRTPCFSKHFLENCFREVIRSMFRVSNDISNCRYICYKYAISFTCVKGFRCWYKWDVFELCYVLSRGGIWEHVFLTAVLDGGVRSASCCEPLPLGKEITGYVDGPVANPFCPLQRRAVYCPCRSPSRALIIPTGTHSQKWD